MKKSKFLAIIVVATIFIQLFAAGTIQAKAVPTSSAMSGTNSQSSIFVFNINDWSSYFPLLDLINHGLLANLNRGFGQNRGVDHVVVSPNSATIIAGQSQTYSASAINKGGHGHDVSNLPGIVWSINSGPGTYVWTGNTVQITRAGIWTVAATYPRSFWHRFRNRYSCDNRQISSYHSFH